MVCTVVGLNSQPLSFESSAFTTRPQLLCSLFSIEQYLVGLSVTMSYMESINAYHNDVIVMASYCMLKCKHDLETKSDQKQSS
jgi:hypothetical protein